MTQLHTGEFALNMASVQLDMLVRHMGEVTQLLTPTQQITLPGDVPALTVRGDAERLQQVLFNLINNAMVRRSDTNLALTKDGASGGLPPRSAIRATVTSS